MIGLECLAVAVFFESRSQPIEGQYAVAEVVMNRVESDRWPNTICDVVFQDKQFSFTHDGASDHIRLTGEPL
jgi:spore germination cell wall hydrolase CwlJ-like protein